jgi:hypothetical protein
MMLSLYSDSVLLDTRVGSVRNLGPNLLDCLCCLVLAVYCLFVFVRFNRLFACWFL